MTHVRTKLLVLALVAGCNRGQAPVVADAGAIAVVPPPRADGRLPPDVRPVRYALDLVVDPAAPRFSGRARIRVKIAAPTRAIVMHARGIDVRRATLRAAQGELTATAALRKAAGSKQEAEELTLAFDQPAFAGDAELDIAYDAPFATNMRGLYHVQEGGAWYAFTQFEPNDARRAFPCFDEPGFKTPFDVTITVPAGSVAFANMAEKSRLSAGVADAGPGGGRVRFEFVTSPPLPTYLVALAVGTFDVLVGAAGKLDVRVIATRGRAEMGAQAMTAALGELEPLARYFARPYPYGKLDLVAVPSFSSGAMENAGLLTFREERLLLDARASRGAQIGSATLIAHELAHQWFGDLVTMAWWDDLWLNEAFATWMADKVVDEWRPATRARLQALVSKSRVMREDALSTARRIRNPVRSTSEALEAFDGVTYQKGRAVLAMTEAWLGEEMFRDGIRRYLSRHAWGNATAGDLYAALAEASGGRPVAEVMESFTTQTGLPVIDATLYCSPGRRPAVRVAQSEYRTLERKGYSDKSWIVPVCLTYPSGAKLGRQCALLDRHVTRVDLEGASGCPAFVYANAGEEGYYRVQLGEQALAPLARALGRLPERERFGVVSNAFAAVRSGDLPAPAFLELLSKLGGEKSRVVWSEIVDALRAIDRALITDAARPAFARFVRELGGPTARRLGWRDTPKESDDDHFMRESVLDTLGELGEDDATLAEAGRLARKWLAAPAAAGGVSSDLARIALPLAAKRGDSDLWQQMFAVFKAPATPEIRLLALAGLTGFEDRALVERTLALLLDGTIKPHDIRYVFPGIGLQRATRDVAQAWLQAHFDQMTAKLPSSGIGRLIRAGAGLCDAERVRTFDAFMTARMTKLEGVDKELRQTVEEAMRCVALAEAQREATSAWLARR
jgi:cytosol alanyl aminopeptidase